MREETKSRECVLHVLLAWVCLCMVCQSVCVHVYLHECPSNKLLHA